ncbi:MAG: ABC-2 transporter, permease component [Halomonadaceae bacterium T82-2]|nr:MAG: ABC-2 transporter, permease component [Halomonadaceae bacterium T82-2]
MNPHAFQPISPTAMVMQLWHYRDLVARMVRRDVVGRYKGSVLGLAWSLFNPIIMLCVYTFVFTVVFEARWGVGSNRGQASFAIHLFAGLIVHGLFAEVLNRAPSLIISNNNYVKKVVFPLEVLPLVPLGSSLFHALVSLMVLLGAELVILGGIPATALLLPLVLLPLIVLTLGLGWLLSSLGVFLRDIGQTITLVTTMLLFLSPIFYPLSALPESFRPFIMANPLTFIIEQVRGVLILGHMPDWAGLLQYLVLSSAVAWIGFAWFQKTRKGFADVL